MGLSQRVGGGWGWVLGASLAPTSPCVSSKVTKSKPELSSRVPHTPRQGGWRHTECLRGWEERGPAPLLASGRAGVTQGALWFRGGCGTGPHRVRF